MDAEPFGSDLDVVRVDGLGLAAITSLFEPFGLAPTPVPLDSEIPGSHWGGAEAGLIGDRLYLRADTPVHSALHEGGHWLLMDKTRRRALHTDAKGTLAEENAVCYLQVLLADRLAGSGHPYDRERLFVDMDRWGYSYRLGSARRWFEEDAEEARVYLLERHAAIVSA